MTEQYSQLQAVFSMLPSRETPFAVDMTTQLFESGICAIQNRVGRQRALVITSPTVDKLWGNRFFTALRSSGADVHRCVIKCTEGTKNVSSVENICREAIAARLGRDDMMIAFGGGVICDLVTVASAWIRRGIRHVRVPTTFVGQIDAGVGIKGGLNFESRKSYVGCFHAPSYVLLAPELLQTLSVDQLRCGFAEALKMAIVSDSQLFDTLEHLAGKLGDRGTTQTVEFVHCVRRSAERMLESLATNPFENQTYERKVDFGHTFSTLLESCSRFGIAHGAAVAVDIALTVALAQELGQVSAVVAARIIRALQAAQLPTYHAALSLQMCREAMVHACLHRGGNLNLVVPTEIGECQFIKDANEISDPAIVRSLERLRNDSRAELTLVSVNQTAPRCLVFDVGGTHLRAAAYDSLTHRVTCVQSGDTPNLLRLPHTDLDQLVQELIRQMKQMGMRALGGGDPAHVAVAFAGPIDSQGHVIAAPTLWGNRLARPLDLVSFLQKSWPHALVTLMNDVTAAGYRYLRGVDDDLCIVTVGSGIGNKVFVGGEPCTGHHGRGGEIGHLLVDGSADALVCDCGERGHLGGVASGRGALRTAQRFAEREPKAFRESILSTMVDDGPATLRNEHLVSAFHQNDPWAVQVITYVARPLAQALATVHLALGIERFVIYGGFGLALGEAYRKLLARAAKDSTWQRGQDWDQMIELGCDDDHSGLIGAGCAVTRFLTGQVFARSRESVS